MTRRRPLTALLIPPILLFGCVSGAGQTGTSSGPEPTVAASPPIPTAAASSPTATLAGVPAATVQETVQTLGDPHITLSPPGSVVPAVSSDTAYHLCLTGVIACFPESPTAITLARMTDTAYGTVSSAGKVTLTLNNTLVWAISWIGSNHCLSAPGAAVDSPPPPPSVHPLCDQIAFVDATTGKAIFTDSYAHQ